MVSFMIFTASVRKILDQLSYTQFIKAPKANLFVDAKIESIFPSPYSKVHDFFASLLTQESDGCFIRVEILSL
jgi:hypothetical protein